MNLGTGYIQRDGTARPVATPIRQVLPALHSLASLDPSSLLRHNHGAPAEQGVAEHLFDVR